MGNEAGGCPLLQDIKTAAKQDEVYQQRLTAEPRRWPDGGGRSVVDVRWSVLRP